CPVPSSATSSVTLFSPSRSALRMRRRIGSARTLNLAAMSSIASSENRLGILPPATQPITVFLHGNIGGRNSVSNPLSALRGREFHATAHVPTDSHSHTVDAAAAPP